MWSISRASDLLPESTEGDAAANILLICPQDPNSILKTIFSAITRYPSKAIHFYVVQEQVDVLARHFILLRTFFDESLPIRQRATTYLHLFGNAAITEADVNYVAEKASDLMDLVLDDKQLTCMEDVFDLSLVKQRDRDDWRVFLNHGESQAHMMGVKETRCFANTMVPDMIGVFVC